jgi:curved DNA-binding protein CbpA
MVMMPTRPTAEGTLAKTPLSHLLVYMLDQHLTGSTVFENTDGPPHVVYFEEGRPSKIRLGKAVEPLDRVLLDLGLLDQATLAKSLLTISKSGALHGQHLVDAGLLAEAKLIEVLRTQLARKLGHLFALSPDTRYAYFEAVNLAATYGGPELTPYEGLSIVMAGVRDQATNPIVDATLDRLGSAPLVLHELVDLRLFGLQPAERAVVDLVRSARLSLKQLLAAKVAEESIVKRTIYALAITRHLDTGTGKLPVGVAGRAHTPMDAPEPRAAPTPRPAEAASDRNSSPAPESQRFSTAKAGDCSAPGVVDSSVSEDRRAVVEARRAELLQKLQGIETSTYYARLEVPTTADKSQIDSAYFALAKRYHPDRLSAEFVDLRPEAAKLFGHISEAYQALTDADRRRQYDESLESGADIHEDAAHIARVVDAALEFQKAEALLKKNDLPGAEQRAMRAVTFDPGQPEYVTLLAWIQAQRLGDPPVLAAGQSSAHYDRFIEVFNGVLAKEERYERALFYRGMLLKRAGHADRAIRDFRLVAQINPRNIDAAREVRLFDMRTEQAKAPAASPSTRMGLFSKIFKK